MADVRRFVRDNLVFIAAFGLPAVVAGLFMLATAIPTWTVPLPQHDLLIRIERWDSVQPQVTVEFTVQGGQVEAVVRPVPTQVNPAIGAPHVQRWAVLRFDHRTMELREVPLHLPQSIPQGETRTVVVDALVGTRVIPGSMAPDGYTVTSLHTDTGGGIVGDIFGMSRNHRRRVDISKNGRTIQMALPPPFSDSYATIHPIGWVDERR